MIACYIAFVLPCLLPGTQRTRSTVVDTIRHRHDMFDAELNWTELQKENIQESLMMHKPPFVGAAFDKYFSTQNIFTYTYTNTQSLFATPFLRYTKSQCVPQNVTQLCVCVCECLCPSDIFKECALETFYTKPRLYPWMFAKASDELLMNNRAYCLYNLKCT